MMGQWRRDGKLEEDSRTEECCSAVVEQLEKSFPQQVAAVSLEYGFLRSSKSP